MITTHDILAASTRLGPHIRRTPVMSLGAGAFGAPGPLVLKLEQLQHTGSFKPRGAFNTLLSQDIPRAGVAAASGGNHGAAVAYAAKVLGVRAKIFVPEISSPAKIARIQEAGADLRVGGERYADALATCEAYIRDTGALSVHAYDADTTIAGQGTIGPEWEEQAPNLDTILVAVGGGGLIAGIARWFERRIRVVGVEPTTSRCLHASLEAGRPVDVDVKGLAADSLGARNCGARVFAIARAHVDRVVLVSDDAIREAQTTLWRTLRVITEPGGAAAFAALLSGAYKGAEGERIGVLVCGANVEFGAFPS